MKFSNQANHPLKNSFYSLLGYIFPIIFFILITPILVTRLGLEHYGLYLLINTILLFVALLDFGISSAFIKYLAQAQAENDTEKITKLSKTANFIFLAVGLLGFAVIIAVGYLLSTTGNVSDPDYFRLCFILAGISFIFTACLTPFQLTPRACLKFNYEIIIALSQITIFNLGALLIAWTGHGLKEILIWQIAINILLLFSYALTAKKLLTPISWQLAWDKATGKILFGFGLKTFIGNIASLITNQLDRLIIPIFLGTSALTYYGLPGNITTQTGGIANALTSVLFPLSSQLQTTTQENQLTVIYARAFRLISVIASAITLAIIIFRTKILYFWLGGDFYLRSATIMLILALVGFVLALSKPAGNVLLGLGKNKFIAIVSSITALLNLILLIFLIPLWGLVGAALAFFISVLPYLFYLWFLEVKIFKLTDFYWRQLKLFGKIIIVGLVFWPICQLLLIPQINNVLALLIIGPGSIVAYLLIYWLFGFFEQEDLLSIKKYFLSTIK